MIATSSEDEDPLSEIGALLTGALQKQAEAEPPRAHDEDDLGQDFEVTQARIHEIEEKAMAKLAARQKIRRTTAEDQDKEKP